MARHAKQSALEIVLGKPSTSMLNYWFLKLSKKKTRDPTLRDSEKLKECFAPIGPLLSSKTAVRLYDIKKR